MKKPFFYGWWVVLSCGIIALWGGGLYYSISGFIQGLITAVMTVGAMIGTTFTGWVFDFRGEYQEVWLTFIAATLAVIPVILAMRKPHGKRGESQGKISLEGGA